MELRDKIADVISEGRDRLIDRSSSEIADAILALPEIRDGQRALEAIARQGQQLLDDGTIGREYKARS